MTANNPQPATTATISTAGTGTPLIPGEFIRLADWPDVRYGVDRDFLSHPCVAETFGTTAGLVLLDRDATPPAGATTVTLHMVGRNNGGASGHEYYRKPETAEDSVIIAEYPRDLAEVGGFDREHSLDVECPDCGWQYRVDMIAWLRDGGARRYLVCECERAWESI